MELQIFDTQHVHNLEKTQVWPKHLILCLDFDGVLHSYTSGWQGAITIPDPPVPGAMEFLVQAVQRFQVHIYSNRCNFPGGMQAMAYWLTRHIHQAYTAVMTEHDAQHIVSQLWFDTVKPPAHLVIDDRVYLFRGTFPSLDYIANFKPWYKSSQSWSDQVLTDLFDAIKSTADLEAKTNPELATLLLNVWAEYDVTDKTSWLLMEVMKRLGAEPEQPSTHIELNNP